MARSEFGGSEGGYTAKTGFNWAINRAWSTSFTYTAQSVDFENSKSGDYDWCHYGFDQETMTASFLYNW